MLIKNFRKLFTLYATTYSRPGEQSGPAFLDRGLSLHVPFVWPVGVKITTNARSTITALEQKFVGHVVCSRVKTADVRADKSVYLRKRVPKIYPVSEYTRFNFIVNVDGFHFLFPPPKKKPGR